MEIVGQRLDFQFGLLVLGTEVQTPNPGKEWLRENIKTNMYYSDKKNLEFCNKDSKCISLKFTHTKLQRKKLCRYDIFKSSEREAWRVSRCEESISCRNLHNNFGFSYEMETTINLYFLRIGFQATSPTVVFYSQAQGSVLIRHNTVPTSYLVLFLLSKKNLQQEYVISLIP